jgi:hypothetical protein
MSDDKQTGMPLHFRILIALVVGTIVGVAINPGAVELPDEQITATLDVQVDESSKAVTVEVNEPSGFESVRRKFQSQANFQKALSLTDDTSAGQTSTATNCQSTGESFTHNTAAGGSEC